MRKFILKNLNFVIVFLFCLPLIALQSTLFKYSIFKFVQPNFILIVIAYLGLKRSIVEGAALSLLIGRAYEVSSGAYPDVLPITFFVVFMISKLTKKTIFIPNIFTIILFIMFITVIEKIAILSFMSIPGGASNLWQHTLMMAIPNSIVNGICAVSLFPVLTKLDKITFKDPSVDSEYDLLNKDFDS